MKRFSARAVLRLLRFPSLQLLILAVLVNPIFASLGDLHESSQAGSAHLALADGHGHEPGVSRTVGHDRAAGGEEGEKVDLVDALMHAVHCCGHLCAIPSAVFVPQAGFLVEQRSIPRSAAPGPAPYSDHFRPPIAI